MTTAKKRKTVFERPDREKNIKTSRLIFRSVFGVFLAVLSYALFFSGFLTITAVEISGNSEVSVEDIKKIIAEETDGKHLGILPKNNLVVFPRREISARLKNDFKKIRGVTVERSFPGAVFLRVDERRMAFWYLLSEKSFAIDENGAAYEEISSEEFWKSEPERIILKGETGNAVFLGEEVADREYVGYISRIKTALKDELGIETENLFETPGIISNDIRVETAEGWKIYLNAKIPLEKELEILKVFLEKSLKDKNRSDLEYVDLRSENKIFYKLKNSEEQKEEENKEEVKGEEDKKVEEKKDKKKKK